MSFYEQSEWQNEFTQPAKPIKHTGNMTSNIARTKITDIPTGTVGGVRVATIKSEN